MVAEATLNRSDDKVTSYIQRYVTLAGAEKKDEVLALFDNMRDIFPQWTIMTCPFMHQDLQYISQNCERLFGYGKQQVQLIARTQKHFDHVHPSDQHDLFRCISFMHDHYESVIPLLHYQYRIVLHYRFKKSNGQYIYLHDERAVLNLPGSGNLYFGLFRDVTDERSFNGVKAEIFNQQETLSKIAVYKPSLERSGLTPREGELVTLLKQGFSTKEIAWYLNISHHTVRNIKSKLFEKFSVNNTVELLNMTA